jgi:hypothetical protein
MRKDCTVKTFRCGLGGLSRPRGRGQRDDRFPQRLRAGDTLRERQAQSRIAERKVKPIGIKSRTLLGAEKLRRIKPDGVAMVIVHVRDRSRFSREQSFRTGKIRCDVLSFEVDGASKAGVEMRGDEVHSPERKIGEACVKLGLGMTREKAPADPRLGFRRTGNRRECPEHGQPWMSERVAATVGYQKKRSAAVESRETKIKGEPSASVATLTNDAKG